MATKPAVEPPRGTDPALTQTIRNIRERFQALEADTAAMRTLLDASTSAKALTTLQQQVNALTQRIATITGSEANAVLSALLAMPNGLVVLRDGQLVTRTLQPGFGIVITYPDGFSGDPIIAIVPTPDVLPLARSGDDAYDWSADAGADFMVEIA